MCKYLRASENEKKVDFHVNVRIVDRWTLFRFIHADYLWWKDALLTTALVVSYLFFGATRLDKDGKVPDLVRDLVQQDGDGGDGTNCRTDQERRSDGQAVRKIMCEVGCQVQVTRHFDVCVGGGKWRKNGVKESINTLFSAGLHLGHWVREQADSGAFLWWRIGCFC